MTKQKLGMGRTVRCPRCKYENLAIDIWCERCGTPVDWQGALNSSSANGNGREKPARNGNGHPGGLAALAGALPWLKHQAPAAPRVTASQPVQPAAAPPVPEVVPSVPAAPAPNVPEVVASVPNQEAIQPATGPETEEQVPSAAPARVFCPKCGQLNEASNKFCPRCGQTIAAAATGAALGAAALNLPRVRLKRPRRSVRLPQVRMPRINMLRMSMPRVSLPRMSMPRMRLPRLPMVAWAIAAVVLVLLIAPLAYVLSPSARHLAVARSTPKPALTRTGTPAAGQGSALAAAIPGVEAKTGLKYSSGSCPTNTPCLRKSGETTGLNAAAVQFSTAGTGGRQCAGYVYQNAGSWHFLNATCGLPGQLSPLVGSQATVHVPGQCANVRDSAGLQGGIVACLNDGTGVRVDGGPNYADGKLWWHLEKNGWMAHEFLVSA